MDSRLIWEKLTSKNCQCNACVYCLARQAEERHQKLKHEILSELNSKDLLALTEEQSKGLEGYFEKFGVLEYESEFSSEAIRDSLSRFIEFVRDVQFTFLGKDGIELELNFFVRKKNGTDSD